MRTRQIIGLALSCAVVASSSYAQETPQPGTYPVTLPPRTFQAVVAYLKRQPWEDVQPLMAALAEAAQASMPPQGAAKKPVPPAETGPK